ncbi:MAG: inositol monophosphatase [Candidatus Aenigmarchaeota archaeon]|nr:inositol monophosphatase [Candidatus Aenigmarchaeota archaeon]
MSNYSKELKVAINAAKEAGKIQSKYFRGSFKTYRKSDKTPVTIVDKQSERKIVSVIKQVFPEHNFLGEEFSYKKTHSKYTWIIDPIDGTKNFVRGMPFFGSCIGLEINGEIVVGVINMPAMNLLAFASKGNGAFVNNRRVSVSTINAIEKSFVVFGDVDSYYEAGYGNQFFELLKRCDGKRGYGDTIGYILLAQGHADIMIDTPSAWDIAAAKIIVEEAGGKLTDFEGENTIYSGHSIATNGRLHDKVINLFKKKL